MREKSAGGIGERRLGAGRAVRLASLPVRRLVGTLARLGFGPEDDLRTCDVERERLLAELEAIFESLPDAVVVYDPGGRLVRANPAAKRIFAYSAEHAARPIEARIAALRLETPSGEPLPAEALPFGRALRGERVIGVAAKVHLPTGETLRVSASAAPIRARDGTILGVVMVVSDVTALHELQERHEDLLRAVSHDVRTPIAAIQLGAGLLERELAGADLPSRARRHLRAVATNVVRVERMIEDLVDALRVESAQLQVMAEEVRLGPFLDELRERLDDTMEMRRVRVRADAELVVRADPHHLERILSNLLSNALKYSPPGSEVHLAAEAEGEAVRLSVTDRGPGIAPEARARLFRRFSRLASGPGLGLGLYISKGLVEAQGGRIWHEPAAEVGATFAFTLPRAPLEAGK